MREHLNASLLHQEAASHLLPDGGPICPGGHLSIHARL